MICQSVSAVAAPWHSTLKSEMQMLHKRFHVDFVYDASLNVGQLYKGASLTTMSLDKALQNLFHSTGISYKQKAHYIILTREVPPGVRTTEKTKAAPAPPSVSFHRRYTVSGYVRDAAGETLVNATIWDATSKVGTITNEYGYFSITLPEGVHLLRYSYLGFADRIEKLKLQADRHQDIVRWCFWQTPPYRLAHSILSIHAPAYERCGDHADAFCDARGDCYLVLSDGMGSGSTASLASRVAVRTLRRMILCDMPPETAIRLVNTLLMAETNTENFATLDVLCMSADTGEMTLWKSGAAATLLAHGGTLRRIGSESFPVGILPDALPARRRLTAYDGDTVLLLSDGISEAEFPYIRSLCTQGLTPEALAKAICDKAAVFCGGEARDDMTVIAARMTARDRAGSTRSDNTSSSEDRQYAVTSHTIL